MCVESKGGHATKRARRQRLVAQMSTARDVKRDCNTRKRSREEEQFVAFQTLCREASALYERCSCARNPDDHGACWFLQVHFYQIERELNPGYS